MGKKSACPGQAELVLAGQVKLSCFLLAEQETARGREGTERESAVGLRVTTG